MGPADTIAKLKADRAAWSPEQILDDLAALAPLPDEYDPEWQEDDAWERAYKLIALSDLVAEHRLADGVGLVLDRMAHGDPGETMRGMHYSLEAAVNPEWWRLAEICLSRCNSPRPGTRYWAVDQLGVIRDPASVPAIVEMLDDPEHAVAVASCRALMMIAQTHPDVRDTASDALRAVADRRPELAGEVEADLDRIDAAADAEDEAAAAAEAEAEAEAEVETPKRKVAGAKPKAAAAKQKAAAAKQKAATAKPKATAKQMAKKAPAKPAAAKQKAAAKPAAKKPAANKPAAKKAIAKAQAAAKQMAKKPAAKKPAVKKSKATKRK